MEPLQVLLKLQKKKKEAVVLRNIIGLLGGMEWKVKDST